MKPTIGDFHSHEKFIKKFDILRYSPSSLLDVNFAKKQNINLKRLKRYFYKSYHSIIILFLFYFSSIKSLIFSPFFFIYFSSHLFFSILPISLPMQQPNKPLSYCRIWSHSSLLMWHLSNFRFLEVVLSLLILSSTLLHFLPILFCRSFILP